jgi:hypothetical protein
MCCLRCTRISTLFYCGTEYVDRISSQVVILHRMLCYSVVKTNEERKKALYIGMDYFSMYL